jgi:hypothetical protein
MMNLQDFASIAEIVGGFAVLATLVYLSIQIKSNTRQLRFTASHGIAESLDRAYDPIYSEHIAPIWLKGNADLESISAAERVIFDGLVARQIHNVANMLDARESALIPKARADKMYNKFFTDLFSSTGIKQWISENPEMGEMVDEYVKAIEN